jgi:hypothetical protein
VRARVRLCNPRDESMCDELELPVDTCSTYTWIKREKLARLGVKGTGRRLFRMIGNRAIEREVGEAVTPSPHPRRPSLMLGLPRAVCRFSRSEAHSSSLLSDSPCLGHHSSGPGGLGPGGTIGPPPHTGRLDYVYVDRALNLFRS